MSKQSNKKATLTDFLAKKLQKEQEQNKTLDIKISSMERTITVKKPTDEAILDYIDDIGDGKNIRLVLDETMKLVYRHCPELQNTELHEALEIKDPYDVINVLFDIQDKQEIVEQFTTLIGYKTENIADEIKTNKA